MAPLKGENEASQSEWSGLAWAAALFLLGCSAAIGLVVPAGNEFTYLTILRHRGDPSFLPGDWTFGSGFQEFFVWLTVFGPIAKVVGIEALGLAGRLVTWVLTGLALLLIGRRLGARPLAASVGLLLWLGLNQSMGVGATKIIAEFQASSIAFMLLCAALAFALDKRPFGAMLLAGLAFSLHPGVGLWGSSFLVLTLLIDPETRRQAWRLVWLPIAAGLPGAIPVVISFFRSNLSSAQADFLALRRLPHHVDPLSFGVRGPLLLGAMLTFNLLLHWQRRTEFVHRFLLVFQLLALIPVVLGVLARLAGVSEFLVLHPFRVLPALVPALFMLNLAALVSERRLQGVRALRMTAPGRLIALTGVAAIVGTLVLWNPVMYLGRSIAETYAERSAHQTDLEQALRWVAIGTAADAVVLGPPANDELFYLTERSQYVSWQAIPYDRQAEWRRRLEAVMPAGFSPPVPEGRWDAAFATLPIDRLVTLEPAVDYIVTMGSYGLPMAFESGEWHVYAVDSGPPP